MGIKSSHYQQHKMKGRVRWNEANLNEIEANKPVRKKIDEPKTPYHPMINEEDGSPSKTTSETVKTIDYAAHAEALKDALNKVALISERHSNTSFGGETSSDEEGLVKQKDAVSFEEKRKAHYDEFKKVKGLQEKAPSFAHDDLNLSTNAREVDIEEL
ncbi:Protein phosphatase inhibitor 2 (IPP-2) [Corchorus capsularis]|uniref:Protein phosphatase inhibitor 2 (IPP-2) n=1 Tax=Corchorus capsularis TaxID=210143 RepID=A0A1R3IA08_COCAP|nr:Protein phosphatase inhibitor 2 (IPP-2) [Corchorus capsularis]